MNQANDLLERALNAYECNDHVGLTDLMEFEIRAYLAEPMGNELGVSEKDRNRLFYGFLLDCNAIGPESAGVNLARGIKALLKHHGIEEKP